jgi:hypothetical protein
MTESEWLECTDPTPMLEFLRTRFNDRKARLFGCGFLRSIWQQLDDKEGSRQAVCVSEEFADGKATRKELRIAGKVAEATAEAWSDPALEEPAWQAVDTTSENAWAFFERVHYETTEEFSEPDIVNPRTWKLIKERVAIRHALYIHVLRDLFGNPFRPVAIEFAWLTPTVTSLATAAYEERSLPSGELETTRLAILADALEEGGCDNTDILTHLRGPGPHVRGCWAVDLLTGKK